MDKKGKKKGVRRQQVAPGIFMEKHQEVEDDKTYYYIKIELQIFTQLDFRVDFAGSQNVVLEGSEGLVKRSIIEPFSKVVVAKLILNSNWSIKTKFKFSMQLPPLEIQRKHLSPIIADIEKEIEQTQMLGKMDSSHIDDEHLLSLLQKNDWHFVDQQFLPIHKSVAENIDDITARFECLIHWRRAKFIVLTPDECKSPEAVPHMFYEGIKTTDVRQGKLNDSWLLSAISVVAQSPKLIERIILTKSYSRYGLYRVKLCRMGAWQVIALDDYFPCYPLGEPIFSKNNGKELWVILLEKAFAKLYGNYMSLEVGNIRHALIDLTGCPTLTYTTTYNNNNRPVAADTLWENLKYWNQQKYLIALSTKEVSSQNAIAGLVKEHAYCLPRVVEREPNIKLVKVLNPWGTFEWTGEWSKTSPLWTKELIEDIKPELDEEDGSFWISYQRFLDNFETINVCMTKGWNEFRTKGKFISCTSEKNTTTQYFCSRWYYHIKLDKRSKVVVGLHQEDERCLGVKETRPYVDIGLMIVSHEESSYKLVDYIDTEVTRECFIDIDLEPGDYYIVPRSSGMSIFSHEASREEAGSYNTDSYIFESIAKDTFEKYDIKSQGVLAFHEMNAFFEFIDKKLTEKEYAELLKEHGRRTTKATESDGIAEQGFVSLFAKIMSTAESNIAQQMLWNLGYTKDLFSYRTRVFKLTVHSEIPLHVESLDALKNNIDHIANKLLIRKYGKNIHEKSQKQLDEVEVYSIYYFNR